MVPSEVPLQLIEPNGTPHYSSAHEMPGADELMLGYQQMVIARRLNEQCRTLAKQGLLRVFPSSDGQEACQVAAAMALSQEDWMFPSYRDSMAVIGRGVSPSDAVALFSGRWHSGYDPSAVRVAPLCTPLATHLIHAVGFAWAAKLKDERTVVLAMCGDGATSEGDFHEALNLAGVSNLPVVFLVQNNGFAISVPVSAQSAAPSLAHKGVGYGMPGRLVDGNDLAAILSTLTSAVKLARDGGGPTLIEARTYRTQPHTESDDDTRYRDKADVALWTERDPIKRLRAYLIADGSLNAEVDSRIVKIAEGEARNLRESLLGDVHVDLEDLFRHVYSEPTQNLRRQRDRLRDELERTL